uniref:Sulfotransfer_1 domain-containing protein n=1 Tax=Strongyloides papillosus TaxID=174720 RepID=A0A0N5BDN9_STREA
MGEEIFSTDDNTIKPVLLALILFLFGILSINLLPENLHKTEINMYERSFARYLIKVMGNTDDLAKEDDKVIINETFTKYMGLSPKMIGIVPPFIPITLRDRIRTAPQYNLLACSMHKHMSSMISPAMCYLRNETQYIEEYGEVIANNHNACIYDPMKKINAWFHDIKTALKYESLPLDDWTFFSFSRDPIERFISGFSNICVDNTIELGNKTCYDCGTNLECFIETLYKDMIGYASGKPFMRYEVAAHFYPQSWMCDYFQYFNKYKIIPYSSATIKNKKFIDNLTKLLRKSNVPSTSINFLIEQFETTKTHHRTVGKKNRKDIEKQLKNSPYLMEKLYQMFYYDFILFNYDIPKEFLWKGPDVVPPDTP